MRCLMLVCGTWCVKMVGFDIDNEKWGGVERFHGVHVRVVGDCAALNHRR